MGIKAVCPTLLSYSQWRSTQTQRQSPETHYPSKWAQPGSGNHCATGPGGWSHHSYTFFRGKAVGGEKEGGNCRFADGWEGKEAGKMERLWEGPAREWREEIEGMRYRGITPNEIIPNWVLQLLLSNTRLLFVARCSKFVDGKSSQRTIFELLVLLFLQF